METWRLSKIEEELDQLSVTDISRLNGKAGNLSNQVPISYNSSVSGGELPIYCSTDQVGKSRLMQEINPQKEGLRKITEKYDSLGKLRSSALKDYNRLGVDGGKTGTAIMSDGASDISDPNPSSSSTVSNNSNVVEGITDHEILQVEVFFRSHKTDVHVCRCLANLYFATEPEKKSARQNWEFSTTGIPLLLLDSGEHHRKRRLHFIMAEKGTGFVLFKDVIDHLTKYSAPHSNFHTMHLSTDHHKLAGLSFDDMAAATEFHSIFASLTADPDDDVLNLSKKKKKKEKKQAKPKKYKAPKKSDISQPCCFVHVTKLERPQLPDDPSDMLDKESMGSAETLDDLSS